MSDKKNNEIAVAEGIAVLANNNILEEAMADEYAGLEFSIDRIKLPAGGGTVFELPAEDDGDGDLVKEIVGVIVYNHPAFSYYESAFAGGHAAPDCSSIDGKTGTGNPGGNCKTCPFNKFGSGEGQSKKCKNKRMLYIMCEGELFPVMLSLPTGSLKAFSNYAKRQLAKGRILSQIVTKITLKKATNDKNIVYSQAVFSFERALAPEEIAALANTADSCRAYSTRMSPEVMADDDVPFVDPQTGEVMEALN